VSGYRGTYGFDLNGNGKPAGHFTGSFDSRNFIDPAGKEILVGSSIPVLYSRFDPSLSRPADELRNIHLLLPIVFFILSLFALLLSIAFFYFNVSGRAQGNRNP
jgi:hypothetical protein